MKKILYYIRNKRQKLIQRIANYIIKRILIAPEHNKPMWYSLGLTLNTYCIVAFKLYLN